MALWEFLKKPSKRNTLEMEFNIIIHSNEDVALHFSVPIIWGWNIYVGQQGRWRREYKRSFSLKSSEFAIRNICHHLIKCIRCGWRGGGGGGGGLGLARRCAVSKNGCLWSCCGSSAGWKDKSFRFRGPKKTDSKFNRFARQIKEKRCCQACPAHTSFQPPLLPSPSMSVVIVFSSHYLPTGKPEKIKIAGFCRYIGLLCMQPLLPLVRVLLFLLVWLQMIAGDGVGLRTE